MVSSLKLFLETDGGWPGLEHEPQQVSVKRMHVRPKGGFLPLGGGGGLKNTCATFWRARTLSLPPEVVLLASVSWQSFTGFQMCAGEKIIGMKLLPEAFTACILRSWRWLISGVFYKTAVLRITSLAILGEDGTEQGMRRMLAPFITEVRVLNAPCLAVCHSYVAKPGCSFWVLFVVGLIKCSSALVLLTLCFKAKAMVISL